MSTQVVLTLNFASISLVPTCAVDTPIETEEFFSGNVAGTVWHMLNTYIFDRNWHLAGMNAAQTAHLMIVISS